MTVSCEATSDKSCTDGNEWYLFMGDNSFFKLDVLGPTNLKDTQFYIDASLSQNVTAIINCERTYACDKLFVDMSRIVQGYIPKGHRLEVNCNVEDTCEAAVMRCPPLIRETINTSSCQLDAWSKASDDYVFSGYGPEVYSYSGYPYANIICNNANYAACTIVYMECGDPYNQDWFVLLSYSLSLSLAC